MKKRVLILDATELSKPRFDTIEKIVAYMAENEFTHVVFRGLPLVGCPPDHELEWNWLANSLNWEIIKNAPGGGRRLVYPPDPPDYED